MWPVKYIFKSPVALAHVRSKGLLLLLVHYLLLLSLCLEALFNQGGTSFVDLLCFCSVLCLLCLCACMFICALWSPAGKGLTSWLSFVVSTMSLSLSYWYPGLGVVLDCIDS